MQFSAFNLENFTPDRFFYTGTARGARDKYEVCLNPFLAANLGSRVWINSQIWARWGQQIWSRNVNKTFCWWCHASKRPCLDFLRRGNNYQADRTSTAHTDHLILQTVPSNILHCSAPCLFCSTLSEWRQWCLQPRQLMQRRSSHTCSTMLGIRLEKTAIAFQIASSCGGN